MDRGVIGEFFGQMIPLHACTESIDDGIKRGALVDALGPGIVGRIEFEQDRFDAIPEIIGHAPDGGQGFVLEASFHGHFCLS